MFLANTKLNQTELLIYKVLTNLYISHDDFISINNILKEYCEKSEVLTKNKYVIKNNNIKRIFTILNV